MVIKFGCFVQNKNMNGLIPQIPVQSKFYAKTTAAIIEHESIVTTMSDIDKNSIISSPPLKFSSRHGDNCQILRDGSQAKRAESFCKGEKVINCQAQVQIQVR